MRRYLLEVQVRVLLVIFSFATRPASWPCVTSWAFVEARVDELLLDVLEDDWDAAEATWTWAISPAHGSRTDDGGFEDEHRAEANASVPPMSRRELLERGLHVAVLWARSRCRCSTCSEATPEFFAVRRATPGDIVVFALAVTFVPPLALLAVRWLVGPDRRDGRPAGGAARAGWPGLLGVHRARAGDAGWDGRARSRRRRAVALLRAPSPRRTRLTVLGPAPLVLLALFLASGSAEPRTTDAQRPAPAVVGDLRRVPGPLADGRRRAHRRARYPNFARLAGDATWYRNTASVDQDTPYAVPAILDGRSRRSACPSPPTTPQHLQPVRRPLPAARARGRDHALRAGALRRARRRAALGGRRGACTRTSCSQTTSRTSSTGSTTCARPSPRPSGAARDQARPLRPHPPRTSPTAGPGASRSSSTRSRAGATRGST